MDHSRRRLDDLKTAARRVPEPRAVRRDSVPAKLEEIIGGCEAGVRGRRFWLVETPFEHVCERSEITPAALVAPLHHDGGTGPPMVVEPRQAMVLDIETGGFAGAPVFLIGLVLLGERPLSIRQFLARDYPEEEGILRALAEVAATRDTWVTFNGKSFDEPFLRDRATLHHVPMPAVRSHVDLLHAARRQWRHSLPNCRLGTLEEHVLKRPRIGDVPSCDVPDLFHHFIRTGNAAPLGPVLEHNRIDLVSSTELLVRLSVPAPEG